eukprot:2981397-Pleurochrysis_carterae.AAC.1
MAMAAILLARVGESSPDGAGGGSVVVLFGSVRTSVWEGRRAVGDYTFVCGANACGATAAKEYTSTPLNKPQTKAKLT